MAPLVTCPTVKFLTALCIGYGALLILDNSAQAMTDTTNLTVHSVPLISQFDGSGIEPPSPRTPIGTTGTYFVPASDIGRPRGPRSTTGTRGGSCLNDADAVTAFTGLGPSSVAALTVSPRPQLAWYLPESEDEFPVEFRLSAVDGEGLPTLLYQTELAYTAGLVTYQLPEDAPALEIGKEYRWQVIVKCNPNRPSHSLVSDLPLQRVAPSTELVQALEGATTDAERAIAYGNAGIWFEALARVTQTEADLQQRLLTGLLKDLATAELDSNNEDFGKNLDAVAEAVSAGH